MPLLPGGVSLCPRHVVRYALGGLQMNEWKWVLLVTGVAVIVSAAITSWYLLTVVWLKALFNG